MPRNASGVVVRMRMKTKVPKADKLMKEVGVDNAGRVQKLVTEEVLKRIGKYMPRRTGELEDAKTDIASPTRILTRGPYARYVFFGVSRSGKPLRYTKTGNPLAGPHWDRRMVKAEGRSIVRAVRRKIERGG